VPETPAAIPFTSFVVYRFSLFFRAFRVFRS